jgi:DNA-binding NarL/FixJ family response regulator
MASNGPTKHGSQDPRFPVDPLIWPKVAIRMQLAEKQMLVVEWMLLDLQNKQIAERMGIGEATVKSHLQKVFAKTRVSSRMQLTNRVHQLAREIERRTPPDG